MNKRFLSLSLIGGGLLFLAGCAGYRVKPLTNLLSPEKKHQKKNEQDIVFAHKVFSSEDCRKYLGREVIKAGYQPIQIMISNQSDRDLLLSSKNISLPCLSVDEVMSKIYFKTVNRAVGYGIGSLFIPLLLIPAIVDSIWSSEANTQIQQDYGAKTLEEVVIRPGSMVNGLVFVARESFLNAFTLTLVDVNTSERFVFNS